MDTALETPLETAILARDETVALWNPTAAVHWSLLFTPALGAWLSMRNWQCLGQRDKARQARYWFIGVMGFNVINLGVATWGVLQERELGAPWWTGLVLWSVWGVASAYPQIAYVDEHHGEAYPRRSWAAPLVIALGVVIGFSLLAGLIPGFVKGFQAATGG